MVGTAAAPAGGWQLMVQGSGAGEDRRLAEDLGRARQGLNALRRRGECARDHLHDAEVGDRGYE